MRPGAWLERTALRDWRAVTVLFFSSVTLDGIASGHLLAFTPLFLRDELHLPEDQVGPWTGLLAASTFAVAFPLAPFWGSLAERYSRKLIIVRASYLAAVAYLLCAFTPDLVGFFIARLLLGLTFGNVAVIIATQTLLTPDRRMASAISAVQAALPIAQSVGPPLGALALPWLGLRGLFLVDGALALTSAILLTLLMPEPPGRDQRRPVLANVRHTLGLVMRRPALRWNFSAWFLTRAGMSIVEIYLPVRIAELVRTNPATAIGWIVGGYGVLTSIATWATGRLVDRVGATRLFWPAMAFAAVVVLGLAVAPWVWLVAVLSWARAIPVALTGTVLYAHLARSVLREERAPVLSLTPTPRNLAMLVGPLVAAVAATAGASGALLLGALAFGAATWVGRRMHTESEARAGREGEKEAGAW